MALVLTRKFGEFIVVEHAGERMRIGVDKSDHTGQVRVYFDAPHSFTIHREEIQARVDAEKART